MADRLEHIRRAVPVLDIGAINQRANQQAKDIGHDVALAPLDLLARVIAVNTAAFRGFHALAIFMELFLPDIDGMEMVNWLVEQKIRSRFIMTAKITPELAVPAVLLAEAANLFKVKVLAHPVRVEEIQISLQAE